MLSVFALIMDLHEHVADAEQGGYLCAATRYRTALEALRPLITEAEYEALTS